MAFSRLLGRPKVSVVSGRIEEAVRTSTSLPLPAATTLKHRASTPEPDFERAASRSEIRTKNDTVDDFNEEDDVAADQHYPLFRTEFGAVKDGIAEVGLIVYETIWRNPDDRKDIKILYHMKQELPSKKSSKNHVSEKKLFVLLEDGLLLQYPESGSRDRGPERELQLSSKSVAFASDFVPGRPFVVHVAQSSDQVGNLTPPPRGLFARFNRPNIPPRAVMTGLFLVLAGPEEMEHWLTALKKVIQQLAAQQQETDQPRRPATSCGCEPLQTRSRSRSSSKNQPSDGPAQSHVSNSPSTIDAPSEDFAPTKHSAGQTPSSSHRQRASRNPTEHVDRYSLASTTRSSVNAEHQMQLNQLRSSRASTALTLDTVLTEDDSGSEEEALDMALVSPRESLSGFPSPNKVSPASFNCQAGFSPTSPMKATAWGSSSPEKVVFDHAAPNYPPPPIPMRRSLSSTFATADTKGLTQDPVKPAITKFGQPAIPEHPEGGDPAAKEETVVKPSEVRSTLSTRVPQPLRLPILVTSSPSLLQEAVRSPPLRPELTRAQSCGPIIGGRPDTPGEIRAGPQHSPRRIASTPRLSLFPSLLPHVLESGDARVGRPAAISADKTVKSLKRPSSVQVRSSHAPFLSSNRNAIAARTPKAPIHRPSQSEMSVPAATWERGVPDWAIEEQLVNSSGSSSEDVAQSKRISRPPLHTPRSQSQQLPHRRRNSRVSTARTSIYDFDSHPARLNLGTPSAPPRRALPPPPPPSVPPPTVPLPPPPSASARRTSAGSDRRRVPSHIPPEQAPPPETTRSRDQ